MDKPTNLLLPFDPETQELLHQVDKACSVQLEAIIKDMEKASLAGATEYKPDIETLVWSRVAKAYGILMNRAIESGWVQGVLRE